MWEDYLGSLAHTPFADLSDEQIARMNHGRTVVREAREARRAEVLKPREVPLGEDSDYVERLKRAADEVDAPERETEDTSQGTSCDSSTASDSCPRPSERQDLTLARSSSSSLEARWRVALQIAEQSPRMEALGEEMRALVEYIRDCQRRAETPQMPHDVLDLFWPRPKMCDMADETVPRRDAMAMRVIRYLWLAWERKGQGMVRGSKSYRVTLAAMRLEREIERYAAKWRSPLNEPDEATLEGLCRDAAVAYFEAHRPVPAGDRRLGADTTTDPDYITYVRLCRQYKLEVGTLLHEAQL
jgi:hypothetical protein